MLHSSFEYLDDLDEYPIQRMSLAGYALAQLQPQSTEDGLCLNPRGGPIEKEAGQK